MLPADESASESASDLESASPAAALVPPPPPALVCVICQNENVACVMCVPCNHVVACVACSQHLAGRACPLCRAPATCYSRIYF